MKPTRAGSGKDAEQTPEQIARTIEQFLTAHERSVVAEEGRVLFDLRSAKYSLTTEHGRCTLQLWDGDRNIVRRVSAATARGTAGAASLRLTVHRFGQASAASLDILADRDRRTPSTREAVRTRYLKTLERAAMRGTEDWGDWKIDGLRTAMDLEKSFGPAYARGSLVNGQQAWALIGVNREETQTMIDGVLTVGVLWLAHCRENAGGRRLYRGLRIVVPRGMAALTASRLAWMNPDAAQWCAAHELALKHQARYGITEVTPVSTSRGNHRFHLCDRDGNWWEFQYVAEENRYDRLFDAGDVPSGER